MELDYLAAISTESGRFADVLAGIDPATAVPTCPGWSVADLVAHLTQVQAFWGRIVAERLAAPPAEEPTEPDDDADRALDRYRRTSEQLTDALAAAEPGEPVWTWHDDDRSVGFVLRRQAHEALIHRMDAEVAAAAPVAPISADLAADGIDEVLTVMYGGAPPWASITLDGPVGMVHAVDADRSWLIRLGHFDGVGPESGTQYANEPMLEVIQHGTPTFRVAAAAADLDAWLWNRPSSGPVEVDGDATALLRLVQDGVQ